MAVFILVLVASLSNLSLVLRSYSNIGGAF